MHEEQQEPTTMNDPAQAAETIEVTVESGSAVASAPASRRGALLVLGGLVVLLAVFFVVAFAPKGAPANGRLPGDPTGYAMPTLVMPKLDGSGTLDLASLRGKPIVVNFWASWCEPCKAEAALMGASEKAWRSKGVMFIGIDSEDKPEEAKAFMAKYGMDYPSVSNPDATANGRWGVTGYPETFFISRDGRIASKFISSLDKATLDASIAAIL